MFVIEAAVGTWLLTKVLGRDAESGPVEEPTAELPAVPTPMPISPNIVSKFAYHKANTPCSKHTTTTSL